MLLQKIKYARRDAITTPEDKICPEEHDGTRLRLQIIRYAWRNMITTPEDKISVEGRDYDSRKKNTH